ncbi:MAG: carbon starvation CstA family protein [Armatimonadota bacterium]|nr:carbon starvation CstA family protein [Armatimonadota bacterium]
MSSALLTLISLALLALGYYFYGRLVERRCVEPDAEAETPAVELRDGIDYEPARPLMLFGHHFTNIAGAGPIVGPVIAVAYFGWASTLGWIILGTIFIGGVHDYLSLMVSARNDGKSISDIAGRLVGRRAAVVMGLFLWLALILIIAMFTILAAQTLITAPSVVIPNAGLLVVAMFIGVAIYRWRQPLWQMTILGALLLALLLWAGQTWPLELPASWGEGTVFQVWFGVLALYCLLVSVLPIWFLEQPRDYLSSMIMVFGIGVGFVAIFVANAPVRAPAHVALVTEKGPLWPMLFILVACGAVSGFHSLVAGGTTVKQLADERQGLPIAFGSMVMEAAQAVSVVFLVGAGLYWIGSHLGPDGNSLNLRAIIELETGGGPAVAFIRGFANLTHQALPFVPFATGVLLAAIVLNATLLDTLDTCTRLGRFVLTETFGERVTPLQNRWLASIITVLPAVYLGLSGAGKFLWPVFGAANQLIAALAFLVIAVYLVGVARPTSYVIVPGLFVLVTTIGALIYQAYGLLLGASPNYVLGGICVVLIGLAVYVSMEAVPRLRRTRERERAAM